MSRSERRLLGQRPLIMAAFAALFFGGLLVLGVARASRGEGEGGVPGATAAFERGAPAERGD